MAIANPFKPTAGKNPPALIGRDEVIEEFAEGIENGSGAPNRLMRISGMRGMGKTVMLNEIAACARDYGWDVVEETASAGFCDRILSALSPEQRVSKLTASPSLLGVSLGSAELDRAALTLRTAIRRACAREGGGLLITLDEVQDASMEELRSLAVAVQHAIREDESVAFVFAGLPSMIESIVNGKTLTFLRRAIPVELGSVSLEEVSASLQLTMQESGLRVSDALADKMARATKGYPFMVQLVGYYVWQLSRRASASEASEELVTKGIAIARERFDVTVIEPALQRLSGTCIEYLLAMALDGERYSETGFVAARMDATAQKMSPVRARLIKEDVIEAAGWGRVRFAIPHMAEYLNAHRDELEAEVAMR